MYKKFVFMFCIVALITSAFVGAPFCSTALADSEKPAKQYHIVYSDIGYQFVDDSGNLLDDVYETLFELTHDSYKGPQFYSAGTIGESGTLLHALINSDGKRITDFIYEGFDLLSNGQILFIQDGLSGIMNSDSTILIPAQYTQLVENEDGGYLALRTDPFDETPDGVYLVSADGKETATGAKIMYSLGTFSNGLCMAMSADNNLTGFLNNSGTWAIEPQYQYAGNFVDGYTFAAIESGTGAIDVNGNWVLTPKYKAVELAKPEGSVVLVAQTETDAITLFKAEGLEEMVNFPGPNQYFYLLNNLHMVFTDESQNSLVDLRNGKIVMTLEGNNNFTAWDQMGGQVIVSDSASELSKNTLYTAEGQPISDAYDSIFYAGSVDGAPLYVVSNYQTLEQPSPEGTFTTVINNTARYGIIDSTGKELIAPIYNNIQFLSADRFWATSDNISGIIDASGNWIVQKNSYDYLMD